MLTPFRQIMQQWLYAPNKGYYTQNHIGKDGDFYTAVSVSKFFGGAIARYILKMLDEQKLTLPLHIVEIGSNNGDLIADIAEFLKAFSNVVFAQSTFCILEPLQSLHKQQQATFHHRITTRFQKNLHIYEDIHALQYALPHNIFFVANELFDSMPCDILYQGNMLYLHAKQFIWDTPDSVIQNFQKQYATQNAELSIAWESFIKNLSTLTCAWVLLTFDYGDFIARPMNARIYKQHKVYNLYEEWQNGTLLDFFACSDITYDVDFSLLWHIFKAHSITQICNVTQAKFLIELCEILDIFEHFAPHFSAIQLIKQKTSLQGLIAPNAMGERFKALCVCKI